MILTEGRGFVVRSAPDGPWAGWCGSRFLEEGLASVSVAPGRSLARLMVLTGLLPGGFGLVWDHPPAWMAALPPESRQGWWEALSALPGLSLHLQPEAASQLPGGPFRAWVHGVELPTGAAGELWRQGSLGWVPRPGAAWQLPGLGTTSSGEEVPATWLWGEATLPLGALGSLANGEALVAALSEAQATSERGLAQRLAAGAWGDLPFSRRAIGWRLSLLGGAEFQRAGGNWSAAMGQLRALKALLQERLRSPIHLGASGDPALGSLLGRQALREGLPWRASLPLPPAPGAFTPGLAADPREPVPLELRLLQPEGWRETLDHAPVAVLRVPAVPSEAGVASLLGPLSGVAPAICWLPPELPQPGPFDPERPWPPPSTFPFPADPGHGVQRGLFELLD